MKNKLVTQILAIVALVLAIVGLAVYAAIVRQMPSYPVEIWALLPAFIMGFYVLGYLALTGQPPDIEALKRKIKELLHL